MQEKNQLKILPTEEYNRLIRELNIKDTKYKTYPQRRKYKIESIKKISDMLRMANYTMVGLEDPGIQKKAIFSFIFTSSLIFLRRGNKFMSMNFFGLNFYAHLYITSQWSYETGIYKEALYGNTERSNELRILLNFYFPDHHYNKIFDELIDNYRYCEEHGI